MVLASAWTSAAPLVIALRGVGMRTTMAISISLSVGDLSPGMSRTIRSARARQRPPHLTLACAKCQRRRHIRANAVSSADVARPWLPPLLLAAYAFAFAWQALGGGLLIVDDHPGQLYRLARVAELGPWPWRLDPGWWGGYAELQYYPPGAAYLGAVLQVLSLGALGPAAAYQMLLWVIYVLPGATTYLLLVRVLGRPWLALPGAFLALTLSGGSRSGVEEGLRWGLIAARLGWSLLHLEMALPLAWGDSSLGALAGQLVTRPLLLGLCVASALACWLTRRSASPAARERWLVRFAPALTAVIALDAVVIQPLGLMWLPADRLMDSLLPVSY